MKVESLRRFRVEDYSSVPDELQELFSALFGHLNEAFEEVYDSIQGRLSFGDNISGEVVSIDMEHEVPVEISTEVGEVVGAVAVPTDGKRGDFGFKIIGPQLLQLEYSFSPAATAEVPVTWFVIGR